MRRTLVFLALLFGFALPSFAQQGVPNGGYNQNGGSGGGGGITGTVSSPFVPFASAPDTLSDSQFGYEDSGNAVCPNDPAIYVIHTGEGTLCFGPDLVQIENSADDQTSATMQDDDFVAADLNTGANSRVFKDRIELQDATIEDTVAILNTGEIDLGQNGDVGGILTFNGATSGSGTLGVTDDGAALTTSNSILVGTATLSPPTFPFTGIGPGEIFENDSMGNETVDLLNDGTLVLGNATGMEGGAITVLGLASLSGQRFVCVDTDGTLVSSATACVGT